MTVTFKELLTLISQAIPEAHVYCGMGAIQAHLKGWSVRFSLDEDRQRIDLEVRSDPEPPKTQLKMTRGDVSGWLSYAVHQWGLRGLSEPPRELPAIKVPKMQGLRWSTLTEPLSVRDKEARLYLRSEAYSNLITMTDYYGSDAGPSIWTLALVHLAHGPLAVAQNGPKTNMRDLKRHLEFLAELAA